MIATLLASALAVLPQGSARYRAELAGTPVGTAELRVACAAGGCFVSYETRLRLPAESGGAVEVRQVEVEVDGAGRWRGGSLRAGSGEGLRDVAGVPGAVPSAALELVLAAEAAPEKQCLPFFVEGETLAARACVRRDASGRAAVDAGDVHERIMLGADRFPEEIEVSGRFLFIRDAAARVPSRAPRLAGSRVPGPSDPGRARVFCGVARDPPSTAPRSELPAPRAVGESCRAKTAAYLAAARANGLEGRTAVGVAWDGAAFVWHAWAEIRTGGAWIPVDPSFGELPARGPRFTVGRYGPDGTRERGEAGARILACWGGARVEE